MLPCEQQVELNGPHPITLADRLHIYIYTEIFTHIKSTYRALFFLDASVVQDVWCFM